MDANRLKSLPLFQSVSDEDLERIAPFVSEVSVSEGKHLVDEGDWAYTFMAIEEGSAEVRRGDEPVAQLGPGDFFGEVGLLDTERRTATVVATAPMRLITLDRWDMRRLEKTAPSAVEQIRAAAAERVPGS
ncbi:MAG TPA: cyclic nucleotide-binding domain-containing protein [Thermoleophilaceae bacterium]|nr:cyclic nucleotide-binding domain-containing protein [Thermoleophilaceae bacterium]